MGVVQVGLVFHWDFYPGLALFLGKNHRYGICRGSIGLIVSKCQLMQQFMTVNRRKTDKFAGMMQD